MNPLPVDWALAYSEARLVPLPLQRCGNRPHPMLGSGWNFNTVGSRDPTQLQTWWTEDPAANIGIITGARSGVLVLDCDVKGARDGVVALDQWQCKSQLWLPAGPIIRTPSGGIHRWLRLPPGANVNRKLGWLPGVDALGSGGQVAAPPSVRGVLADDRKGDGPYKVLVPYLVDSEVLEDADVSWLNEVPEAPGWLLDDVAKRAPTITGADGTSWRGGPDDELPPTKWLLEHGLPPGRRNWWTYRLAARLWRRYRGDADDVVRIAFRVWEQTDAAAPGIANDDPFTWDDAMKAIRSAERRYRKEEKSV